MLLIRDIPTYKNHTNIQMHYQGGPPIRLSVNVALDAPNKIIHVSNDDTNSLIGVITYFDQSGHLKIEPKDSDGAIRRMAILTKGWPNPVAFEDRFAMAMGILLENIRQIYAEDLQYLYSRYSDLFSDEEDPPISLIL